MVFPYLGGKEGSDQTDTNDKVCRESPRGAMYKV